MKKINTKIRNCSVVALLIIFLMSGCRSVTPPVEYYTLSPLSAMDVNLATPSSMQKISLGIGPLSLPEYLTGSKIITRTSPNKIEKDEFHRWAGSFRGDILRVLSENLSVLAETTKVAVHPWSMASRPDYIVEIKIQELEGKLGDEVFLKAFWTIKKASSSEYSIARLSNIRTKINGSDYESLIKAKSLALVSLSKEIATEFNAIMVKPVE